MKHCLAVFLLFQAIFLRAETNDRIVNISGRPEKVPDIEIVVEKNNPVLDFASKELQAFLTQATGVRPGIAAKPSPGKTSLILGDNSFSRAAGLDTGKLPPEGYYILRKDNRIFLCGQDDPNHSPTLYVWGNSFKRSTLNAVYDFMERFADARFFFPGQYGTVIPARDGLYLPPNIYILERPDMPDRCFFENNAGQWYEKEEYGGIKGFQLEQMRLRTSDFRIPSDHGLAYLELISRFSASHPEYFALKTDGKRYTDESPAYNGQLCYFSGIREEIYQDAKAYLTGKPASSRNMKCWITAAGRGSYFNVMPQDWFYWCGCEACRKIARPGRDYLKSPEEMRAISKVMWDFTTEIADRLDREGVHGTITQMAYMPYDFIPEGRIARNVRVKVAVNGLGDNDNAGLRDAQKIKEWSKKLDAKVSFWSYAMGKHMNKVMPGVPAMMPKHAANFLEVNKDCLLGGLFESETDFFLFNYLNYYTAAKKMWNVSTDTDAQLDDHFKVMFGKGAPMMKRFYDSLEENWTGKILGKTVMTSLGPSPQIPNEFELWTRIYSPAKMKEYNQLFDAAQKAAAEDKNAVERIQFIRKNLLAPLEQEGAGFRARQLSLDSWTAACPGKIHLRPFQGDFCEVSTVIDISRDKDNLIIAAECEEPRMADLLAVQTQPDAADTWQDSDLEFRLNPSGDRKTYYQFVVNANGALSDYKNGSSGINWNSGAKAQAVKGPNGWSAVVTIPLKALGEIDPKGMPANFARHRALKGEQPKETYYHWNPLPASHEGFHDMQRWGRIVFDKPSESLIKNGNFADGMKDWGHWISGGKAGGQALSMDRHIFISGGQSCHLKNADGKRMSVSQLLPAMKPDTTYRLSYFLKTKDIAGPKDSGAGAYLYFNLKDGLPCPFNHVCGTNEWHRLNFTFKTPKNTGEGRVPVLGLWIWTASGEAWFDDVTLEEIHTP